MRQGVFITLEGGEGSGKSTVIQYMKEKLEEQGYEVIVTREPGGVEVAEDIRKVIFDHKMNPLTEALLFTAARKEHLEHTVIPAIQTGKIVLCDRFVHSSYVYQGVIGGVGLEQVRRLNELVVGEWMPDFTFFLDVDPEVGLKRISDNGRSTNRMDHLPLETHEQIRSTYQEVLYHEKRSEVIVIDANQCIEDVRKEATTKVWGCVKSYLESQLLLT